MNIVVLASCCSFPFSNIFCQSNSQILRYVMPRAAAATSGGHHAAAGVSQNLLGERRHNPIPKSKVRTPQRGSSAPT